MKKRIVVTGGNRGIGHEIINQLGKAGHEIILAARNIKDGTKTADDFKNEGFDVQYRELDLANAKSIKAFAKSLYMDFDKLDVLINNAAVFLDNGKSSLSVEMEIIQKTMQINLYGPMDLSKTLVNLMKGSDDGRVINISSSLGSFNEMEGGYTGYRLSKVGLNAFTKIFSADLSDTKIKVNSMCPGWVRTAMGGEAAPRSVEEGADTAVWLATADEIPNGMFLKDRQKIDW